MPAPLSPRRLGALVLLSLAVSGCGALTPSLLAPSALAPSVVPAGEASTAVVTARMPGHGISGRVVDRATGEALGGVRVSARDAAGAEAEATTDADGAFRLAGVSGDAALRAEAPCHLPLDARPGAGDDSSATVLVLMNPTDCAATTS